MDIQVFSVFEKRRGKKCIRVGYSYKFSEYRTLKSGDTNFGCTNR